MTDTTSTDVPVINVTFEEFTKLFELAAPRLEWFKYPKHELIFSCSINGVWPTTRWGYIPVEERVLVGDDSNTLFFIAVMMLAYHDPLGGRFIVDTTGAYRATHRTPIVRFELCA